MKRLFEQIFQKPVRAFFSGLELMNERMQGRQKIDGVVSRFIYSLNRRDLSGQEKISGIEKFDLPLSEERKHKPDTNENDGVVTGNTPLFQNFEIENSTAAEIEKNADRINFENTSEVKEIEKMDRDLRDSKLKLVRFKVLFVKRNYEYAFEESEDLISTNIDSSGFTAWKIAEFIQRMAKKQTRVPEKWLRKNYPPPEYREGKMLLGLPDGDKKYLRVYHQVLDRYQREKFEYEEEQIDVLREIRDGLREIKKT